MTTLHDFPHPQQESPTPTADYLMVDLFGTVVEVRRMSSRNARDANLELVALSAPYHWTLLAETID
jgi:hypothetical protein